MSTKKYTASDGSNQIFITQEAYENLAIVENFTRSEQLKYSKFAKDIAKPRKFTLSVAKYDINVDFIDTYNCSGDIPELTIQKIYSTSGNKPLNNLLNLIKIDSWDLSDKLYDLGYKSKAHKQYVKDVQKFEASIPEDFWI